MRVKAILSSLALVAFLFCLTSHSQAYVGPPYTLDPLSYPNEHPWQHNDTYGSIDSLGCWAIHIVILPITPGMKAILLIQDNSHIKASSDEPSRPKNNHPQKLHFRKSR